MKNIRDIKAPAGAGSAADPEADKRLADMVRLNPRAVAEMQARACYAWKQARLASWVQGWFDEWWDVEFIDQTRLTQPTQFITDNMGRRVAAADDQRAVAVHHLRLATEAEEIFSALPNLQSADLRWRLRTAAQGADKLAAIHEALATVPAGLVWRERRRQRDDAAEAQRDAAQAAGEATRRAQLAGQLLASLESQGVALSLDEAGTAILAARSARIGEADRAALIEHRAEAIEILRHRAEANTLVPVA